MKFFGNGTPGEKETEGLFFNCQAMFVCCESHYRPGQMESVPTADLCHCTGFTETGCKTAGGCWEPWTLQLSLPQAKNRSVSTLWKEETCLAPPHQPVSPVLQPFPKSCVKARGSGCSGASQDLTRACRSHPQCSHAPAAACPAHMHMAFPPLPTAAHGKFIFSCLVCGLWISPWRHGLSKEAQWKCVKSLRNYLQS